MNTQPNRAPSVVLERSVAIDPGALERALGFSVDQSRALFHSTKLVVESSGSVGLRGARLLDVLANALSVEARTNMKQAEVVDALAAAFPSPAARRAVLDAMIVPACIECEVHPSAERLITDLAAKLGVTSHWISLLPALRKRRVLAIKRQLVTRSPDASRLAARTWEEEGLRGVWRAFLFVIGQYRSPALAARFRALGALPADTLGRRFFDHITSRGLSFPGEKHGLPERMLHHDLMHVLNGYGTDAAGECEIGGFYAAFADGDAFTFIVIALATFHLGIPVSPALVTTTTGELDPERVLAAFLRGRRLRVDVMGKWDYWPLMQLPIAEARRELGIADDFDRARAADGT